MRKQIFLLLIISMMISFSTGIFVEIISPGQVAISSETPSFTESLYSGLKNDIFTILVSVFFSVVVYLYPCVVLLVLAKIFSLGFSAAYLLSCHNQGLGILLAVLLPRCLLRMPAYLMLIILSFQLAKRIKNNACRKTSFRRELPVVLRSYALCLLLFLFSSLVEAFLLQAVLSP